MAKLSHTKHKDVNKEANMDEKLYTTEEVANILRTSAAQIHNILSRGYEGTELPKSIRVGRRRLWPESEIKSWISAQLMNKEANEFKSESKPQLKTINRI